MPQTRSTDGTEDDLPTYIRKAFGHDRTWMSDGACHPSHRDPEVPQMAWKVPAGETRVVDGVKYVGEIMEKVALRVCDHCPQQWLCTRWAVDVDERTGTWGVSYKNLVWLKKQTDNVQIIDTARIHNIPIQQALKIVRELRV